MTFSQDGKYVYGLTGYVRLRDTTVAKYIPYEQTFWLREYSILTSLWPYKTDGLIRFKSTEIVLKPEENQKTNRLYFKFEFDREPHTLEQYSVHKDETLLQIMIDLASVLTFLHSVHVWHRDVKPQNILITKDGRAKLIDFTHAFKSTPKATRLSTNVVTVYYRAPELFRNQSYDNTIDVWSLAMILVEIVTGKTFVYEMINDLPDNAETATKKLILDENLFKSELEKFFKANTRGFKHTDQYWQLISKMTEYDPTKRIIMSQVLHELKTIAKNADIKFSNPSNSVRVIKHDDYYKCDDVKLLNRCKNLFGNSYVTYETGGDLVQYLISKNVITEDNCLLYMRAVVLILETVLYDCIFDLSEDDQADLLQDAIKNIINKYGKEMFLSRMIFKN